MKAYKVAIQSIEQNLDEAGGSIFYSLNPGNINVQVIIHPNAEIDLEGNFNEEEMYLVLENFYHDPTGEVEKYFPSSSFNIPFDEEEILIEGKEIGEFLASKTEYVPAN